jgi:hypothetical protein
VSATCSRCRPGRHHVRLSGGRDRRRDTLPAAGQARVLPGARPAGPPVGCPQPHRAHQPGGPGPCPVAAHRGRPRGGPDSWPTAGVPRPGRPAPRARRRDCGRGPQARGARLAPADQGRGLPLEPGHAHGGQGPAARAAGRSAQARELVGSRTRPMARLAADAAAAAGSD